MSISSPELIQKEHTNPVPDYLQHVLIPQTEIPTQKN